MQGQTNPWGQNFDVNRKLLPLRPFVAKHLFDFRFYTHFSCFSTCIYSPGAGQTALCGQNVKEKPCHFAHLLQVSNKYLLSLILYIFFLVFIHVYSPGAGADNVLGSEF